ncbi:response regulator receiver protein [Xylanimonas cellulosilytica DSM 15894]|uniref:Response regulator receiver protein n=1 Tax=Xylanimonas cellulosilytica (strain DSM 15894 / JCM 12276 / CECT 5975 / KCTC 9989 / LMG 20990 / NBRC 107835 / XIL07) TaxID=446471 RepID=D1C0A7_XYLCX|nr:response regulator receiver protein [Xylanimonas cellulosilytica DSM 15894]
MVRQDGDRKFVQVLLVEDDPGDVLMTREALDDHHVPNELHVVRDGVAALDFLHKRADHEGAPTPDLVLLDLNLPRMPGLDVLKAVKGDPALARIPVIVLTTSDAEDDIVASYALHANAYVTKPVDFDQFVDVVRKIDDFFVSVVRLPRR